MRNRNYLAALSLIAVAIFAVPAVAGPIIPITVSNVQVDWSQGEGINMNSGGIYYAGPITFVVAGKPIIVWCDDLNNLVYIGSANQYYETDAAGANSYLYNPALTPAQQITLDHQIAGLSYQGTILAKADGLTPSSGAEIQAAIWELERPGLLDTNVAFQSGVDALLGDALTNYNAMLIAGYTYGQLEAPGCDQALGTITYSNNCQIQGQIFVSAIPEPVTLSIFGAGLVGAAALRRRKRVEAA
jgi:hypothetical protein